MEFKKFTGRLPLVIVDGSLPSLLRLDWFKSLGLGISGINNIGSPEMDMLSKEFASVFEDGLSKYVRTPISFNLDPQVAPRFLKPQRVPFVLQPKVDTEFDKLSAGPTRPNRSHEVEDPYRHPQSRLMVPSALVQITNAP